MEDHLHICARRPVRLLASRISSSSRQQPALPIHDPLRTCNSNNNNNSKTKLQSTHRISYTILISTDGKVENMSNTVEFEARRKEAKVELEDAGRKLKDAMEDVEKAVAATATEMKENGRSSYYDMLVKLQDAKFTRLNSTQVLFDGAVEKHNGFNGCLAAQWNQRTVDRMIASSPVSRFMINSIASIKSSAVNHWDFSAPPLQKKQSDRVRGLREKVARHYKAWKNTRDCKCQLSRVWGDKDTVTAAHLLKHATAEHMREQFDFSDINDYQNILVLAKGIEGAFEMGRIYFEWKDDRTFILQVWDKSVLKEPIHDGAQKKIGDCVGKALLIPSGVKPPYKRVLSDHAQHSYYVAVQKKWIEETCSKPREYGSPLKDNVLSITMKSTQSESLGEWVGSTADGAQGEEMA